MSEEQESSRSWIKLGILGIFIGLAVVAFVSQEVEVSEEPEKINTSKVSDFLEERTGYSDCSVEKSYDETKADATCTRDLGEESNTTFESGKKFTAELDNGSIVVFNDYRY